jgi:hypothetical protein
MAKNLPGINYSNDKSNPTIDSDNSFFLIPFYKDDDFLNNFESYNQFIKHCERMIRTSKRYRNYISYLKNDVGLHSCQVFEDVTDLDGKRGCIEMHHGPIFTLYDYCAIVIEYYRLKKMKITTFRIVDTVLAEHEANHVQVVMLSKTAHQEVHNRNIFLNYKQGFGDLSAFIKKYHNALSSYYKDKINNYIERSLREDSDDYDTFEFNKNLIKSMEGK